MVGFKHIQKDSGVLDKVSFKYILYCFFVSSVIHSRGFVISEYTDDDACRRFPHFTEEEIVEAIKALLEEDLIDQKHDGTIVLGVVKGELVKLFGTEEGNISDALKPVSDALESFYEESSTTKNASLATSTYNEFQVMVKHGFSEFGHKSFAAFWRVVYVAFFQEEPRAFLAKDHGQLKTLQNCYNTVTLIKMIVHYLSNSDKYTKYGPNVGHLLTLKDTVFHDMMKLHKPTKSKARVRKKVSDDENAF